MPWTFLIFWPAVSGTSQNRNSVSRMADSISTRIFTVITFILTKKAKQNLGKCICTFFRFFFLTNSLLVMTCHPALGRKRTLTIQQNMQKISISRRKEYAAHFVLLERHMGNIYAKKFSQKKNNFFVKCPKKIELV